MRTALAALLSTSLMCAASAAAAKDASPLAGRWSLDVASLPMPPDDLLEAGLLVYLDGLGLNRAAT